MVLTLEETKDHLRIERDITVEDAYIEELIAVAEADVANRMKYNSLDEAFPSGDIPMPVKHAIKLIVAHYYANREPVAFAASSKVPMMLDSLLYPYVRYKEGGEVT